MEALLICGLMALPGILIMLYQSTLPVDPDTQLDAEWEPKPGVEKFPDFNRYPEKRPMFWSSCDSWCKCPRCGSTNVKPETAVKQNRILNDEITKRYTCLYCGFRRSRSFYRGVGHGPHGWRQVVNLDQSRISSLSVLLQQLREQLQGTIEQDRLLRLSSYRVRVVAS